MIAFIPQTHWRGGTQTAEQGVANDPAADLGRKRNTDVSTFPKPTHNSPDQRKARKLMEKLSVFQRSNRG